MVVVKIELWPDGSQERMRPLGQVVIANDGTGDNGFGNYDAALAHSGKYWGKKGIWKRGRVEKHDRMLSPYHLLQKVLNSALGGRQ